LDFPIRLNKNLLDPTESGAIPAPDFPPENLGLGFFHIRTQTVQKDKKLQFLSTNNANLTAKVTFLADFSLPYVP